VCHYYTAAIKANYEVEHFKVFVEFFWDCKKVIQIYKISN